MFTTIILFIRRNKDTMALVLWQPPKPRLIPNPEPEEDDGNNNNNNGESVVDLNNMPTYVEYSVELLQFNNFMIDCL
jgi:hypothetical protein